MRISALFLLNLSVAAVLMAVLATTAVQAQTAMTKPATRVAACEGERSEQPPVFGAAGAAACDAALTGAAGEQRAVLLRTRALHHLAAGEAAAAAADLEAAALLGPMLAPWRQRSFEPSLALARTLSARLAGDQDRAQTLAQQAFNDRPYSRQTLLAALTALGPAAPLTATDPLLRRLAQLDPAATAELFRALFEHGQFEAALDVLSAVPPRQAADPQVMGRHAYALAALGRTDEAAALLAGMSAQNDPAAVQWRRMTETRALLAARRFDEAVARLNPGSASLPASHAAVDVIEAFADQAPPGDRPDTSTFHAALERARREAAPLAAQRLFSALAVAEAGSGDEPAEQRAAPDTRGSDGTLTVSIQAAGEALAEAEEAALARAAQAVRRTGATGMTITGRSDLLRTGANQSAIAQSTLTVRPAGGTALSPATSLAWRVIPLDALPSAADPGR